MYNATTSNNRIVEPRRFTAFSPTTIRIGQTITSRADPTKKYYLENKVKGGDLGAVYIAVDSIGTFRAIKISEIRDVSRECAVQSAMSHLGYSPKILAQFILPGCIEVAMMEITGTSLYKLAYNGQISLAEERRVLFITLDVLVALTISNSFTAILIVVTLSSRMNPILIST